jgi:transposase
MADLPKLVRAVRDDLQMHAGTLDDMVAPEHVVRDVWRFVEKLDLSRLLDAIRSREGKGGAPAFDPRVLLCLWLYATVDGVGSARRLSRLCEEHVVYRWIAGGLSINHHTLSDFRSCNGPLVERLLVASVVMLAQDGLVDLDSMTVAHDSTHVRACAGIGSMRGRPALEQALVAARERLESLARQGEGEDGRRTRSEAARERAAGERVERLQEALGVMEEMEARPLRERPGREQQAPRVSTTDPQASLQRMANGGKNVAHNVQFTTETNTRAIVAVQVSPVASDTGTLAPAMENLERVQGALPGRVLADRGFFKYEDIGSLERRGCLVSMPDLYPGAKRTSAHGDYRPEIAAWRKRMKNDEEKRTYRLRASTVEWSNACVRRQGLQQLTVRGRTKVLAVALLHALAHNMTRIFAFARLAEQTA